jgi:uncharacterized Zn finger protein (UPF0148 family)
MSDYDGTPPPPTPEEEHRFPCPQCGADYRFDPAAGRLVCDFCGHTEEIEGAPAPHAAHPQAIRELDFRAALEARLPQAETQEVRTTSCPNCGARLEFDGDTHSKDCPFCATPVVVDTGTTRVIKPRGVLPFALDEASARKEMTDWLGRLWFAPNGLQDYARKGRRMQGIYVPYWTFDAQTESRYAGMRGTIYYVTTTVMQDGKPRQVRQQKIRWRPVSGRVARFFDDVRGLASRARPKGKTQARQPWHLAELMPNRPISSQGSGPRVTRSSCWKATRRPACGWTG